MLYKAEMCVWFLICVFEVMLVAVSPQSPWRYVFASFALLLSVASFYAWKVDLLQRAREMATDDAPRRLQVRLEVRNMVIYHFTNTNGDDIYIWPTTFETIRLCSSIIGVIVTSVVFAHLVGGHSVSPRTYFVLGVALGVAAITLLTVVVDSVHRAQCM